MLADEDAAQTDVDKALEDLNGAYEALEEEKDPEPEPVNKDKLQTVVEGYQDMEQGSYTDESWAAFQDALKAAQDVLTDENAAQEDVDATLNALNAAFAGLKETSRPADPNLPGTGGGTDTGGGADKDSGGSGADKDSGGSGADSGDAAADTGDRTNAAVPAAMLIFSGAVILFAAKARKRR